MGGIFSQEEEKEVAPYLQGISPASLAAVIWDTINEVNMDECGEEEGNIGISFDSGASSSKDKNCVTFWNEGEITTLPKNVFLEIMKTTGQNVVKTFEDNYDLELSKDLGEAVSILKDALEYLEEYLTTLDCEESVEDYKNRLDDEESDEAEDSDQPESIPSVSVPSASKPPVVEPAVVEVVDDVQGVEVAKGSSSDDESDSEFSPPSAEYLAQRRVSRGMVGVLDRLPELRRRFGDSGSIEVEPQSYSPIHGSALDKVKKKVKLLSMFHVKKDEVSPELSPEQEGLRNLLKSSEPSEPVTRRKKLSMRSKSLSIEHEHQHITHQRSTGSLPDKLSSLELLQQMAKKSSLLSSLNSPISPVLSLPGSVEDNVFADSPTGSYPESDSPTSPGTNSPISTTPGGMGTNSLTTPGGNGVTLPGIGRNSPTPSLGDSPTLPEGVKTKDSKLLLPSSPTSGRLDTISPERTLEAKRAQLAWAHSLESNSSTQSGIVDIPDSSTINIVDHTVSLPGSVDVSSPK